MRRSRFREERILGVSNEHEAGRKPVGPPPEFEGEVIDPVDRSPRDRGSPRPGIRETTLDEWKVEFGGKHGMWIHDPAAKEFWLGSSAGHGIYVEETSWVSEVGEEIRPGATIVGRGATRNRRWTGRTGPKSCSSRSSHGARSRRRNMAGLPGAWRTRRPHEPISTTRFPAPDRRRIFRNRSLSSRSAGNGGEGVRSPGLPRKAEMIQKDL